MELKYVVRVRSAHELSRMGIFWRSSCPGRAARQIVCRRPTPQLEQWSSALTTKGGSVGDEANDGASPSATSRTRRSTMTVAMGDDEVALGWIREACGSTPLIVWSPAVDLPLASGRGESVSCTVVH